ncbi:MAG: FkbM family methyltransferase [Terracidiphilus sp.]|jgi:FkbM family methyltransferase
MDRIFQAWFIKRRLWDNVQLNASTIIACDLWDEVSFGIWWGGETYELKETPYFKSLLKPHSVVFDVGANVGYYSLTAAPLVGFEGRIYAFEPATRQFGRLKENASRNGFRQILPYKLALSDKAGEAVLHLENVFNTGSASLRAAGIKNISAEMVTCTTLDEFVESQALDRLDVIKIDVEGYELAVLNGGRKTLERFHPVLLVEVKEHHQRLAGFSRKELFDWLIARNYLPFRIKSDARLTPIQEPEDGNLIVFLQVSQTG